MTEETCWAILSAYSIVPPHCILPKGHDGNHQAHPLDDLTWANDDLTARQRQTEVRETGK